jgi:hypothetical protein
VRAASAANKLADCTLHEHHRARGLLKARQAAQLGIKQ